MRKMQSFNENMLGKCLGFNHMHENKMKTKYYLFLKREIDLKKFEIFLKKCFDFFLKYFGENRVF